MKEGFRWRGKDREGLIALLQNTRLIKSQVELIVDLVMMMKRREQCPDGWSSVSEQGGGRKHKLKYLT